MSIESNRKQLLFIFRYDLYVDLNAMLADYSLFHYSDLFIIPTRFNPVETKIFSNGNNVSRHMFTEDSGSFHYSKHEVNIISERCILIELISVIM